MEAIPRQSFRQDKATAARNPSKVDTLAILSPQLLVDVLYIIAELSLMPQGGPGSHQFRTLCDRIRVRGVWGSECGRCAAEGQTRDPFEWVWESV